MQLKKVNKGFTLIELLVVIAIIGILSTIVLVSVNSARNKAKIAAIKGSMEQARVAAELYYDGDGGGDYDAFCSSADEGRINTAVTGQGGTAYTCATTATTGEHWCIEVTLPGTGSGDYCVDDTGYAGSTASCVGGATPHIACQ
ncbi:MAG: type II secretion system protein [Candidatus Pacebacteria bacterium]|nr:type II secretion system protein [Candidatus Paceibacterota bacterium]